MVQWQKIKILSYKKFTFFVMVMYFFYNIFNFNVYARNTDKKICVVGDSFAGHFAINEGSSQFDYYSFPIGQITKSENIKIFKNCILNDKYKYILFATGVNDQAKGTDIILFEKQLKEFISLAKKQNKVIFFHTYMMYRGSKGSKYTREDYDNILVRLSKIYDNVIYLDMSNLNDTYYLIADGMHYNKFFYKFLKAKLLYEIDKYEYKIDNINFDKKNKMHKLTIIGNAFNETFIKYEKNKLLRISSYEIQDMNFINENSGIKGIMNSDSKYVLFSFVPSNMSMLKLEEFELKLREYISDGLINHKVIFFYTYDNFLDMPIKNNFYTVFDYNNILIKLADEYENVNYIDMYDFTKDEKGSSYRFDLYHAFFDNLYKKMINYINH